ncbi:MAG: hypothetical protein Fur006_53540 [Coleofasciculaceae cyanobacterium]
MISQQICDLIFEALQDGYLPLETENQLKKLLKLAFEKNDPRSFEALIKLQQAVENGWVKREALEIRRTSPAKCIQLQAPEALSV